MDLTRRPAAAGGAAVPMTASNLHSRTNPSGHVLDLRAGSGASSSIAHALPTDTIAHQTNHTPAPAPHTAVHERHIASFTDRFERARNFSKSAQISKFGTDRFGNIQDPHKMYDKFGNPTLATLTSTSMAGTSSAAAAPMPDHHAAIVPASRVPEMPHLAATQHAAMSHMVAAAPAMTPAMTAPSGPTPSGRPSLNLGLSPGNRRFAATAAAVAVMAGYVWFQNYPKMALQNASNQAGISASLPGYIPSSYQLTHTDIHPGLITLSFASPSVPEQLTIAQHRTTWDSRSLLDNFVAKNADDYATFSGQGLTIYLFGANNATWVNHGVWYSIEGASRLSRDQILKIAYSL